MTREQAKEILPIIQAFAEDKTMHIWAYDIQQDKEYKEGIVCFNHTYKSKMIEIQLNYKPQGNSATE